MLRPSLDTQRSGAPQIIQSKKCYSQAASCGPSPTLCAWRRCQRPAPPGAAGGATSGAGRCRSRRSRPSWCKGGWGVRACMAWLGWPGLGQPHPAFQTADAGEEAEAPAGRRLPGALPRVQQECGAVLDSSGCGGQGWRPGVPAGGFNLPAEGRDEGWKKGRHQRDRAVQHLASCKKWHARRNLPVSTRYTHSHPPRPSHPTPRSAAQARCW